MAEIEGSLGSEPETGLTIAGGQSFTIRQPCSAPAPLVINGSPYVGCQLDRDHDGQHKVIVTWGSTSG